jgi:adenosylmethionine-8-amino-7-oxononanoate aminotransferase
MSLSSRDKTAIWHPYTQHKTSLDALPIVSGKGAYLFDDAGKSYLDLISSWWVTLHGHCQPDIAKAIYEQATTLDHVVFAGFTHEPAIALAEKILKLAPPEFTRVFYSDNGSTSVEVALKMAYQYWRNQGKSERRRFMAFELAYHGDTFGAMSVGRYPTFFSRYSELFFAVDTFEYPATWAHDAATEEKEKQALLKISDYLAQYGHEVCALIIEPLVQGSAGMRMCTPRFLRDLETLIQSYGILIIYDEVFTSLGRCGDYFACRKVATTPDIICLSKGVTGGFLTSGMTLCHEKIYAAFLGDTFATALVHGHSFTGNPISCAAGLASLTLLEKPETQNQLALIEKIHHEELVNVMDSGLIEEPRVCGTIAAFNVSSGFEYGSAKSFEIRRRFNERGLLIRPLGNVIYFVPPYCVTESELRTAYQIVIEELEGVTA